MTSDRFGIKTMREYLRELCPDINWLYTDMSNWSDKTVLETKELVEDLLGDYSVNIVNLDETTFKNMIRYICEKESEDIEYYKKNNYSQLSNKMKRVLLYDKKYLISCVVITSRLRNDTEYASLCWSLIKDLRVLAEESRRFKSSDNNPVPKDMYIELPDRVYFDYFNSLSRLQSYIGENYVITLGLIRDYIKIVYSLRKVYDVVEQDDEFKGIFTSVFSKLKNLFTYYSQANDELNNSLKSQLDYVSDNPIKLDIILTPQLEYGFTNDMQQFNWHVLKLNKDTNEWQHTNFGGWGLNYHHCLEQFIDNLYSEHMKRVVKESD